MEAAKPLEAGSATLDITIRLNNNCLIVLKRRSDRVDHMILMGGAQPEGFHLIRHIFQGWQFGV